MWKIIYMEFITGLLRSRKYHDYIWVIVNIMTKSTHIISVRTTHSAYDYAKLYIKEVVRLYGVQVTIISDRGAQINAHI